jgi:predicted RNA-binding Zn ribbon-like protein
MDLIAVFDRLVVLADNEELFEIERENILIDAWAGEPPERRARWIDIQGELNRLRQQIPAAEFIRELFRRINDNTENLEDLFGAIRVHLDACNAGRPRLREISLRDPAR